MKKEIKHELPPNPDGVIKNIVFKFDTEEPDQQFTEIFKKVSESKPPNLQEFFIRLNNFLKDNENSRP